MAKWPEFKTQEEEAAFWDSHNPFDYVEAARPADAEALDRHPDLPVTLALKPSVLAHLKIVAERDGIDYQTLLQSWIVARLEQEPWTLESPQADTP